MTSHASDEDSDVLENLETAEVLVVYSTLRIYNSDCMQLGSE